MERDVQHYHYEIPHRLERGMNASKDLGSQRKVDCEIPHSVGGEKETFFKRGRNLSLAGNV